MAARRVCLVGNLASGKSRLADRLAAELEAPIHWLDKLYWGPGWKPVKSRDFLARQREIIAGERWIIDGTFAEFGLAERFRAADAVVYLDVPGAFRRSVLRRGDRRSDLPDGADDTRLGFKWAFLFTAEIVLFNVLKRPRILWTARRCHVRLYRVRDWPEIDSVVSALAA